MAKKKNKAGKAAETLLEADRKTRDAALPYKDSAPVKAMSWASEIGDQPQMLTLCGTVFALGVVRGDGRLIRAGTQMAAAHLLATAAKNVIKRRVDRTRPFASRRKKKDHRPKAGRREGKEETSFPSGHSAGAIAVARAFGREFPEHSGKALAGAGLVALAQIPRCAHYPTDVGAGLAIGWAAEWAVDRTVKAVLPSG